MSDGFSTKDQEATYNRGVAHLLQLVQTHLLKYLTGEPLDVINWTKNFTKVYQSMQKLEKYKKTHPKYSVYCAQLADYFGVCSENLHNESTISLKHDLDLTFIQDTSFKKWKPAKRSLRQSKQSSSQFKISERPTPRLPRHSNRTPEVARLNSLPIAQVSRHLPRKRKGIAYRIYQNQAMWKLNNDLRKRK